MLRIGQPGCERIKRAISSARKKVDALLNYCRWEFGEKQKLTKFDAISAGHNEALVAMGVIDAPEQAERDAPTMHDDMWPIYSHFKRLRFGRAVGDDAITLIPRQPLQYAEVESYTRLVDWQPTQIEVDIIMSIDAIFEMREV